jgi:hypothetical protein
MATEEKIRNAIRDIAAHKRNVRIEEIEWVMNQLDAFGTVSMRENDHQRLYAFNGHRFGICTHHPGGAQVKSGYVKAFLSAMSDAGWYED